MRNSNRELLKIFETLHLHSGPAFKLPYVSECFEAKDLNSPLRLPVLAWESYQEPEGRRYTLPQDEWGNTERSVLESWDLPSLCYV